jgi:hypothetical protein
MRTSNIDLQAVLAEMQHHQAVTGTSSEEVV